MDGLPIIARQEAILFKPQPTLNVDSITSPGEFSIPFEAGSWSNGQATRAEGSTEVAYGLEAGAPIIIGQSVPISFSFQLKGRGPGLTYTAETPPPHDAVLRVAGLRPLFSAAFTEPVTAGTTTSATMSGTFPEVAGVYRGFPFACTAGPNAGRLLLASDYSAARVVTFADRLTTAFTTESAISLLPSFTYAGTSPVDAAAYAVDHPLASVHYLMGGKRRRFVNVRGSISMTGSSSGPGIATFNGFGTYVAEEDAAFPLEQLSFATHSAPVLLQGANTNDAFLINRRPLAISNFTLSMNQNVAAPEDPNSLNGFDSPIIGGRDSQFSCDPLQSFVATRNTLADIDARTRYTGLVRAGYTQGNRWAITMPLMQPVDRPDGSDRANAKTEALQLKLLNPGPIAANRDGSFVLSFY